MIPEETIAEIKRRADLAAVVGRTVKLKKSGKNLVGLCPFHSEKTPSFNVRPDEGFFYCFGCKAAGDVVSFLERTTGRGFLDIVTELADQTGVELPKVDVDPAEEARQQERKRLLRVLELTQVYFRTRLQSPDEGRAARAYLGEARKIDDAAVDAFGLGFGGAHHEGLVGFLKEQGLTAEDGVAAGVVVAGERGPYDFFRQRVTIPIRGHKGQVIAFQGRIFGEHDDKKRPKYVNGPQTAVYDKSVALFGLFESQAGLKRGLPAILVEGPLDAIAVHRAQVPTAVAPCGTGMTPRHVDEIRRRTEKVVVCLDADKAGREAAERAILMFLRAGLDTGLVALPDKDPDQMVQAGRADELRTMILSAKSAIDMKIDGAREQARGTVHSRVEAIRGLVPYLAALADDLTKTEAIRRAAQAFNAEPKEIADAVQSRGRKALDEKLRGQPSPSAAPAASKPVASPSPVPARMHRPVRPFSDPEVMLAEALLTHPQLAARCGVLLPVLRNPELRGFVKRLIELLVRFHDEDPRALLPRVGMRPDGQLTHRVVLRLKQAGGFERPDSYMSEATAARIIEDCILTVDEKGLEGRLGELLGQLAAADERNDPGERKRIYEEQRAIEHALQALRSPTARPLAARVEAVLPALLPPGGPLEPTSVDDAPWAGDPDDDPWAV